MKKFLFLSVIIFALGACKSTMDTKSQVGIKGNWVITSVNYVGSEYFKIRSFQIADSKCFEGSTWSFISNNNKGEMNLTKGDCPNFSSPIVWSITKEGKFGFKIVEPGEKAKQVQQGYFLTIANQQENSFQLIDRVNVGGRPTDIVYQFQKVN